MGKTDQADHSELIANRYRVEKDLGEGGMGVVHRVLDTSTGRQLALKQLKLRDSARNQREIEELFEREFHTLSHLSHPRVVEVYDYSRDDTGPYYTMELLDGGDLNELSPLPWATACALLCDVCSALSLLHSRRFVHRDLSTRNIRCTRDNQAKLIDFGAMIPMGAYKNTVGTPFFIAPESLNGQVMDARTDLFALGAAAYYALTGRHAYPGARTFGTLREAWRSPPSPPSRYVPEIPKELDQLVLSLIHLDIMGRPTSAAEVMERLSAIAGLRLDEQLLVRQAYLSTPTLVGRDDLLLRVRKLMVRAMRHRGGTVMITGASGMGRSRFLDACVLEGKLMGAAVLRADASDANAGNWGAVSAMAAQLLDVASQPALQAARPRALLLEQILPGLASRLQAEPQPNQETGALAEAISGQRISEDMGGALPSPDDRVRPSFRPSRPPAPMAPGPSQELRPQLHAALLDWLLEVSEQRAVVVAVDDVHRIDEPSAAFVALLCNKASEQRVVVAVTAESDAPATSEAALSMLSEVGIPFELRELSLEETERLLHSVFGDVPNVRLLADRLHGISGGSPRAVMHLAQHLLDNGMVRYEAGAWTLPASIDAGDLPKTLSEALKTRVRSLSATVRELAQSMALCSTRSFSFEECSFLVGHEDKAAVVRDLDQLIASDILWTDGTWYALSQASWRPVLLQELSQERARALHLRLAELLRQQYEQLMRASQHLMQANEPERALEALIEYIDAVGQDYVNDPAIVFEFIQRLPENWLGTVDTLIELCEKLGRPRKQHFLLLLHLTTVASVTATPQQARLRQLLHQLYCDAGLDLYEEQDASQEEAVRLQTALALAQQRFETTPESERVLSPAEAIPQLARAIVQALGSVGHAMDYGFFEAMPSLGPLVPLSPALGVIEKNFQSSRHAQGGRLDRARWGWREAIERMDQPDRAGLDELHHRYMRLAMVYTLGIVEAPFGLDSVVEWADQIQRDPLFEVNAWRLRMVLAMYQGDRQRAEDCRKRAELLKIQNSPTQLFEGLNLWTEIQCQAALSDLLGVKQTISGIEKMAEKYPGWIPALHFARGQYQKIRGDYAEALVEFEEGLSLMAPGRHMIWAPLAGAHLSTLVDLGQFDRVKALAQQALEVAERDDPVVMPGYMRWPLALAQAALGEFDSAVETAQAAIDTLEGVNASGVLMGLACETRARVAMSMKDDETFRKYARLCAEQYRAGHDPLLTAKYEKLMQEASGVDLGISSDLTGSMDSIGHDGTAVANLNTVLSACEGPTERAQRALKMLVEQCACPAALLYTMQPEGPALAATHGDPRPPADIDTLVKDYLSAELDETDVVTMTQADVAEGTQGDGAWVATDGGHLMPVLLAHDTEDALAIAGVVVLRVQSTDRLHVPYKLLALVSRSLMDAGDVVTAYAAQ